MAGDFNDAIFSEETPPLYVVGENCEIEDFADPTEYETAQYHEGCDTLFQRISEAGDIDPYLLGQEVVSLVTRMATDSENPFADPQFKMENSRKFLKAAMKVLVQNVLPRNKAEAALPRALLAQFMGDERSPLAGFFKSLLG